MGRLVVLTFDRADEAAQAREALQDLERRSLLALDDSAIVTKDAEGQVHVDNSVSRPMVQGAVIGGLMGILLTFMFPVVGVIFGLLAGGAIGRLLDDQVDKQFIHDVQAALKPGASALFLLIRSADMDALAAALRQFPGQVYQTTLSAEVEEGLREALK